MARIRIVDQWLRSPVSELTRRRAVMVVSDSWAEQRVLMRGFAACEDQTRPTIRLHGQELAIGPAGPDAHGIWGIHVSPPVDGRAQELREELELAARRIAGAKRTPPRLRDEESSFERNPTYYWAPRVSAPAAPANVASIDCSPDPSRGNVVGRRARETSKHGCLPPVDLRTVRPPRPCGPGARTSLGYADAPRGKSRCLAPQHGLARLIGGSLPSGLSLTVAERTVLEVLNAAPEISASKVAEVVGELDGAAWMTSFISRLAGYGIDVIVRVDTPPGPSYQLRR